MIAINEYNIEPWSNLDNVKKKDIPNFRDLFEKEFNYTFVSNPSGMMKNDDLIDFIDEIIVKYKLRKEKKYDGIIVIICGHGAEGNKLVTSDSKLISISEIK